MTIKNFLPFFDLHQIVHSQRTRFFLPSFSETSSKLRSPSLLAGGSTSIGCSPPSTTSKTRAFAANLYPPFVSKFYDNDAISLYLRHITCFLNVSLKGIQSLSIVMIQNLKIIKILYISWIVKQSDQNYSTLRI